MRLNLDLINASEIVQYKNVSSSIHFLDSDNSARLSIEKNNNHVLKLILDQNKIIFRLRCR